MRQEFINYRVRETQAGGGVPMPDFSRDSGSVRSTGKYAQGGIPNAELTSAQQKTLAFHNDFDANGKELDVGSRTHQLADQFLF